VHDPQLYAEVSVKGESPTGMMFFVWGGSSPGRLIAQITTDLGCRAFDCSSGEWLDGGDDSFASWKTFRDHVSEIAESSRTPPQSPWSAPAVMGTGLGHLGRRRQVGSWSHDVLPGRHAASEPGTL
jgi:hypothetical protein